jgi:hypothetical protein
MQRRTILALLALAACSCVRVSADEPKPLAVVLPVHTYKGAPANGKVLSEALRKNVEKAGHALASEADTEVAVKKLEMDLTKPQFLPGLTAVGKELKARYVVYARNGVGVGVNAQDFEEFQSTILINVVDVETGRLIHVYQIAQLFKSPQKQLDLAVITPDAAAEAARRVLEGFHKRTASP